MSFAAFLALAAAKIWLPYFVNRTYVEPALQVRDVRRPHHGRGAAGRSSQCGDISQPDADLPVPLLGGAHCDRGSHLLGGPADGQHNARLRHTPLGITVPDVAAHDITFDCRRLFNL